MSQELEALEAKIVAATSLTQTEDILRTIEDFLKTTVEDIYTHQEIEDKAGTERATIRRQEILLFRDILAIKSFQISEIARRHLDYLETYANINAKDSMRGDRLNCDSLQLGNPHPDQQGPYTEVIEKKSNFKPATTSQSLPFKVHSQSTQSAAKDSVKAYSQGKKRNTFDEQSKKMNNPPTDSNAITDHKRGKEKIFKLNEQLGAENLYTEYKNFTCSEIIKEQFKILTKLICGFLNTEGGKIYLGVDDSGCVKGKVF